jgi:hypothetical protein
MPDELWADIRVANERSWAESRPEEELKPCLRCEWPLTSQVMGCRGGRCPNCGHIYPHGDCSD